RGSWETAVGAPVPYPAPRPKSRRQAGSRRTTVPPRLRDRAAFQRWALPPGERKDGAPPKLRGRWPVPPGLSLPVPQREKFVLGRGAPTRPGQRLAPRPEDA